MLHFRGGHSSLLLLRLRTMSYGDQSNLPERLKTVVNQSNVVYWSSPLQDQPIGQAYFGDKYGVLVCCPLFWFHLSLLWPCFCCCACYAKSQAIKTDVVLTTTSLDLIVDDKIQKSFPLTSINSAVATTKSENCCAPRCCMRDVHRLIIDDGSSVSGPNGRYRSVTTIFAHEQSEELSRLILEGKNRLQQGLPLSGMRPMGIVSPQTIQRPQTTYAEVEKDPNAYPSRSY